MQMHTRKRTLVINANTNRVGDPLQYSALSFESRKWLPYLSLKRHEVVYISSLTLKEPLSLSLSLHYYKIIIKYDRTGNSEL